MIGSPEAVAEYKKFLFDLLEPPKKESVDVGCSVHRPLARRSKSISGLIVLYTRKTPVAVLSI
jgi:hypothetical protein